MQKLLRTGGIRALYSGWIATVSTILLPLQSFDGHNIFHRGSNWSYFGAYEAARRYLTPPGNEGKLSPAASLIAGNLFAFILLLYLYPSGGCAGTAFWLSCYPIDVIKTKMQTAPVDGTSPYLNILPFSYSL